MNSAQAWPPFYGPPPNTFQLNTPLQLSLYIQATPRPTVSHPSQATIIRDRSLNMDGGGAEDFVKFSAKKRVAPPSNFAKIPVAPPSDLAKK